MTLREYLTQQYREGYSTFDVSIRIDEELEDLISINIKPAGSDRPTVYFNMDRRTMPRQREYSSDRIRPDARPSASVAAQELRDQLGHCTDGCMEEDGYCNMESSGFWHKPCPLRKDECPLFDDET